MMNQYVILMLINTGMISSCMSMVEQRKQSALTRQIMALKRARDLPQMSVAREEALLEVHPQQQQEDVHERSLSRDPRTATCIARDQVFPITNPTKPQRCKMSLLGISHGDVLTCLPQRIFSSAMQARVVRMQQTDKSAIVSQGARSVQPTSPASSARSSGVSPSCSDQEWSFEELTFDQPQQ
jgi:hypothetical protein